MRRGGILCLDLAQRVGWAYGHAGDAVPSWGAWQLPNVSLGLGRIFAAAENELLDFIHVHAPAIVVMEAPLPPQGQTHAHTMRQQVGLAAIVEAACYRHETRVQEVPASVARKAVVGTSRFAKGETKACIMAWCREQGWPIDVHDAADAAVLWAYATERHMRRAAA